jgi:hypothetical protein
MIHSGCIESASPGKGFQINVFISKMHSLILSCNHLASTRALLCLALCVVRPWADSEYYQSIFVALPLKDTKNIMP